MPGLKDQYLSYMELVNKDTEQLVLSPVFVDTVS